MRRCVARIMRNYTCNNQRQNEKVCAASISVFILYFNMHFLGVNEGETIDTSLEKLVIFMTVDPPIREMDDSNASPLSPQREQRRRRSSSFDKVRMELARQRETLSNTCAVL